MEPKRTIRCAVVFLALIPLLAGATTWYVHPDSALNSIQCALDACSPGDTVLVGPGTYYENIDWPYVMGIRLMSEAGPAVTVIDGNGSGSVIHLSLMQYDSLAAVQGFTLRNGNAWLGGGIHSTGGKPLISGNIIANNTAQWPAAAGVFPTDGPAPQGGGIYSVWASPRIIDNVIIGNSALYNGGGIASNCDAGNIAPLISNNTITGNVAHTGGGVYVENPFKLTMIRNNTISTNAADYGGGIACYYVTAPMLRITNNLITMNSADSAGGGIWCYISSSPIIDSCTIHGNTGDGIYSGYYSSPLITYCNITDNAGFAVRNDDPTEVVAAENNWWGDATGPFNPVSNPAGMGDTVSDYVDYEPWQTMPGICELSASRGTNVSLQVTPNPFHRRTTIRYSILDTGYLIEQPGMGIYEATGRLVKSFDLGSCILDRESSISWDGTDHSGRPSPAGVYFLRVTAGDASATIKIVRSR
jgi:parallel beta-helix repeat protein